ncbi:Flp/Fap pilin component [Ammonifex degensii KC4]|uniref:Flp/Fap pilin component n=1 Tax=Ammonifex degensii (strain DSM 10501 / KC4) TaxID=429009 RepID=C9RD41_AMMDK|nr:Flp family type IVb pilin [Ammonifex degensii]ACX52168.1 Flp/Fap pilin component [Ammonifex degensii KC4]
MLAFWRELWRDEEGQGMAEYGLILALIAIVVIIALTALGTSIRDKFQKVSDELNKTQ